MVFLFPLLLCYSVCGMVYSVRSIRTGAFLKVVCPVCNLKIMHWSLQLKLLMWSLATESPSWVSNLAVHQLLFVAAVYSTFKCSYASGDMRKWYNVSIFWQSINKSSCSICCWKVLFAKLPRDDDNSDGSCLLSCPLNMKRGWKTLAHPSSIHQRCFTHFQ